VLTVDSGTAAGIAIGIVAILVSLGIAFWQRRPKHLGYEFTNRRIVTRTSYQESGDFRVMYGKRELKDPYLVVVRVVNDGKVEIRPDDWQEEFTLEAGPEIIESAVVAISSKGLDVSVADREAHRIRCSKHLLNKGEWFDVQMLVDGAPCETLDVSARIAGARIGPVRRAKMPQSQWSILEGKGKVVFYILTFVAATVISVLFAYAVGAIPQGQETVVPALTGKSLNQVITKLHQAHLHLGNEQFVPGSDKSEIVVDQYPSAGSYVDIGSQVSIVIARSS
jgi:PASTA domain